MPCARLRFGTTFGLILSMTPFAGTLVAASPDPFLEGFAHPSAWHHSAPLWVWNDEITEEKIEHQLEMLRSQEVLQAFVHPRPGLITPYLSDRWLDLYDFAVKTAKEKGMLLHIYDENSYPSGFAGGHVYRHNPEWAGKGMVLDAVHEIPDDLPEGTLAVYRREGETITRLPSPPLGEEGDFLIARVVLAETRGWTGDGPYVDLLAPGLTEKFLEITYEPYRKRFGDEFGKTVRGAFTDEPHLVPAGKLHWTPRLPDLFKERYGYDLLDSIPSLFHDVGDYRAIRFDFYQLLLDEFIDRWAKPYQEYCAQNDLLFTGHYWEHEWPRASRAQDNMAMYAFHQMPAIDCLMNRYSEDPHAQFGNVRAVMELSSIANQLGLERRLCEVYGAGGWEMNFADQKRIADWLGVLGVNFFNQHLTYMTLRGARKRDHPLSFSDHAPWWDHYHTLGKYLARLSYVLSEGEEIKRVLVLEPTTTGWVLERADGPREEVETMGADFQAFITNLSLNQVEYDLASERTLRDHGRIEGRQFVVGERAYDLVLLHPTCENLTRSTFELLERHQSAGGSLLCLGGVPQYIDGRPSPDLERVFSFSLRPGQFRIAGGMTSGRAAVGSDEDLIAYLNDSHSSVRFPEHSGGKLFHQFRDCGDFGLLFLCNTSADESATGRWKARGGGASLLDLFTGAENPAVFANTDGEVEAAFEIPPAGSALYRITRERLEPAEPRTAKAEALALELKEIRRLSPNSLSLDYLDYEVGEEKGRGVFFFEAQNAIYQAHGLKQNPWDRAVQYKETILEMDVRFDESTGFTVSYPFKAAGFETPPALSVVVEQPEKYRIAWNDAPYGGGFEKTVDPAFKVLNLKEGSVVGENRIQLAASPFSVHHEVEPVYVMGDFQLESGESGWTVVPPKPLGYGSWREQGLPFYSDAVRYSYAFENSKGDGTVRLQLGDWSGTTAAVTLNGEAAGVIAFPPYQIELTSLPKGTNTLDIDVYGSLKNLYGPHHGNPELGAAWPTGFLKAPKEGPPAGSEYHVLDYGLFEEPILEAME